MMVNFALVSDLMTRGYSFALVSVFNFILYAFRTPEFLTDPQPFLTLKLFDRMCNDCFLLLTC